MPKKKKSVTQKSKKAVPDTVVLLPDSMLKRYKNKNSNKNVNVNIIQNKISVPTPKKARRRTAKQAVKSGNIRMQGPGMLFSSPPATIQSPVYATPPYPVQPVRSRPVIPGIYSDPDRHKVNVIADTKSNPIISNENPNNIEPVNNQARLVPTTDRNAVAEFYKMQQDDRLARLPYQSPQDISIGLDRVLANINPFGGLNTRRADMLPMASESYEAKQEANSDSPAFEYSDSDPGMEQINANWQGEDLSKPAVSSQVALRRHGAEAVQADKEFRDMMASRYGK